MGENIRLSFEGIWNHKVRSLLTMLGIIIGIASIITIVSTIKGTNDQIKQNLIGSGTNAVTVSLTQKDSSSSSEITDNNQVVKDITDETISAIEELDGVSRASVFVSKEYPDNIFYKNSRFEGNIYGTDSAYFEVNSYRVIYGRGFTDTDFSLHRKVVIIDTDIMNNLFAGNDPIGEVMEISGEPFTVIGVVKNTNSGNVVISSVSDYYNYSSSESGSVYMPLETWPVTYEFDAIKSISVKADSTDQMAAAGSKTAEYLNNNIIVNTDYEYEASNVMEQASQLQSLANSTNQQLVWIAGIALLVGGIGVMNIMLVSVTERTREIGLKKALGAKKGRILSQFLTEAATLTSMGGILGVACGIGLAKLISSMSGTPSAISVPACVIGVVFSMVIGIVFGLIPAVKASKLNPIDALRRD